MFVASQFTDSFGTLFGYQFISREIPLTREIFRNSNKYIFILCCLYFLYFILYFQLFDKLNFDFCILFVSIFHLSVNICEISSRNIGGSCRSKHRPTRVKRDEEGPMSRWHRGARVSRRTDSVHSGIPGAVTTGDVRENAPSHALRRT